MSNYTEDFYHLNAQMDHHETERHQVSRSLRGLKDFIREQLMLQSMAFDICY